MLILFLAFHFRKIEIEPHKGEKSKECIEIDMEIENEFLDDDELNF